MDTQETPKMTITYVPIGRLEHAEYNPRTLTQAKFEDLQRSIDELDMLEPLVVNQRDGRLVVVSGNQRLEAMKVVGYNDAPCNLITVSLEREKVINIRLNKSSGEDNDTALAELLLNMEEVDRDLTGWDDEEILKLQDGWVAEELAEVEKPDKPERPKAYTKEQLSDFATNYVDPEAAKLFIGWLP